MESNHESTRTTVVAVGSGSESVARICSAERALVMTSVPWSAPERKVRRLFSEAATQLQTLLPERPILCFRLKVDEDAASEGWLTSLGYPEFITMGAGSMLWLEKGKILSALPAPLHETAQMLVERTMWLWARQR